MTCPGPQWLEMGALRILLMAHSQESQNSFQDEDRKERRRVIVVMDFGVLAGSSAKICCC